ncbi:MAG: Hsp20/alpha crystallin family protein [Spirochaetales bacterium]|nr:Hsp20/alpha crystallin family protein [Spirochaetales bacterium]
MNDNDRKPMRKTTAAPCDIFEEGGKIMLRLDMPGVTKESLSIHVENDELQISGKRDAVAAGAGRYLVREIPDRDFYQAYTLDATIDRDKIEAELVNGQLIIALSLKESEKPRKIEVVART